MNDAVFRRLLPSLLCAKGEAEITVRGVSMEPLLTEGDLITVAPNDNYATGDILVFSYKSDSLLVHRLLAVQNGRFFCKGDNAFRIEDIELSQIHGRVTAINKQPLPIWKPWQIRLSLAVGRTFRRHHYDIRKTTESNLYKTYQHLILQKETNHMRYQINPTMDHIHPDDKTLVVFDPESGCTYFFDETGRDILSALETPLALEALLEKLCAIYDATPADIQEDVMEFLADTVEKKVVVTA